VVVAVRLVDRLVPRRAGPLHVGVLGNVHRHLDLGDDAGAPPLGDERLADIGPHREHAVDDVARDEERRFGHLLRGEHRNALRVDILLVERIDLELGRHGQELRRHVIRDQLDGFAGLLQHSRAFGAVFFGERSSLGLGPLRPRRLRRRGLLLRVLRVEGERAGQHDRAADSRGDEWRELECAQGILVRLRASRVRCHDGFSFS
jgi:hypothetical protein